MSEMTSQDRLFENMYILSYVFLFCTMLLRLILISDDIFYQISLGFFIVVQFLIFIFKSVNINKFITLIVTFLGIVFFAIGFQIGILSILICNINVVRIKKFMYADFFTRFGGMIVVFVLYFMGYFNKTQTIFYRSGIMRNTFGFDSPNTLANYFFFLIVSLIILINFHKNIFYLSFFQKIIYTVILFISGYYICFTVTDSRSAQVTLVVTFIGWIVNLIVDKNCLKPIFGLVVLIMCIFLSVYLVSNFDISNNFYYKINDLASYRLLFQHVAWIKYGGIHLLGNSSFTNDESMPVDNQFIYVLLKRGLMGLFVIIFVFFEIFKNAYRKNEFLIYVVLVSLVFKSLFESTIFEYYTLFPILYLFNYNKKM